MADTGAGRGGDAGNKGAERRRPERAAAVGSDAGHGAGGSRVQVGLLPWGSTNGTSKKVSAVRCKGSGSPSQGSWQLAVGLQSCPCTTPTAVPSHPKLKLQEPPAAPSTHATSSLHLFCPECPSPVPSSTAHNTHLATVGGALAGPVPVAAAEAPSSGLRLCCWAGNGHADEEGADE